MKRQKDKYPWPGFQEDFDSVEFFMKLKQKKFHFLGFILAALVLSYGYFKVTQISTESKIVVEIGFSNIKQGQYPDGSNFDKNDLISGFILNNVHQNIPELAKGDQWTNKEFHTFFTIEGIYPMDITLAKQALINTPSNAKLGEFAANYEKVTRFVPNQYMISFRPQPAMPEGLKKKVFEELVAQYRADILNRHLSAGIINAVEYNENSSMIANYEGLSKSLSHINALFSTAEGNANPEGNKTDTPQWQSVLTYPSDLTDLKAEFAAIENLILDEKLLPDAEDYRRKLENELTSINFEIKRMEKQTDFRLRLAELTKGGTSIAADMKADEKDQPLEANQHAPGGQASVLMAMLLSYGPQYYAMIEDVQRMYDKKVALDRQRDIIQFRLERLNAPGSKTGTKTVDDLKALFKSAFAKFTAIQKDLAGAYRKGMAEYEPAISKYDIVHESPVFPSKRFAMTAAVLAILFCGFQALVVYLQVVLEKGAEEKVVQVAVASTSTKITGKN